MARTVIIKGDPIHKEGDALEEILPGQLLGIAANGTAVTVRKHNQAGAATAPAFAVERSWIGEDTETAVPVGDRVEYVVGRQGDEFHVRIAGTPEAVAAMAPGTPLSSAGDGTLKAQAAGEIAIARIAPTYHVVYQTGNWHKAEII